MAVLLSTVLEQAVKLSDHDRGELAAHLLRSLEPVDRDEISGPEWEAAWTAELDRRVAEIRNGTADLIDGDEALAEARARLAQRRPRSR